VLTLSGLGELLVCESGTNPSRLVDRLVIQGLVERTRSATDGREVLLQLTSTGRGANRRDRGLVARVSGGARHPPRRGRHSCAAARLHP
jgi:MarR family transcriptional regulator, organic hydroperoxide resistance regulator